MQFELSGISSGQTRTITIPDGSGNLVIHNISQTLTNKSLLDSTNNIMAKSLNSATTTIDVSLANAPSLNQVLIATSTSRSTAIWQNLTTSLLSDISLSTI